MNVALVICLDKAVKLMANIGIGHWASYPSWILGHTIHVFWLKAIVYKRKGDKAKSPKKKPNGQLMNSNFILGNLSQLI